MLPGRKVINGAGRPMGAECRAGVPHPHSRKENPGREDRGSQGNATEAYISR
jgi:hypothetical protein